MSLAFTLHLVHDHKILKIKCIVKWTLHGRQAKLVWSEFRVRPFEMPTARKTSLAIKLVIVMILIVGGYF